MRSSAKSGLEGVGVRDLRGRRKSFFRVGMQVH